MTTQTTHQFGVYPLQGVTETPLSPVATSSPHGDVDGGTVNATYASFHLQEYQTHANASPWVGGTSRPVCYPDNFGSTQQHNNNYAPLNYQLQSFNAMTQSPTSPLSQSSLQPMSPATATVRTNANHAFSGTHVEVRPDTMRLPPFGSFLRNIVEPTAVAMPLYPPTCTKIPVTPDGKRYLCQCGHRTKTISAMTRHHESLKHSEPKYVCACGKKFSRKDSLTRHEKKSLKSGRIHECV